MKGGKLESVPNLTNCTVCKADVSSDARVCPKCGHALNENAEKLAHIAQLALVQYQLQWDKLHAYQSRATNLLTALSINFAIVIVLLTTLLTFCNKLFVGEIVFAIVVACADITVSSIIGCRVLQLMKTRTFTTMNTPRVLNATLYQTATESALGQIAGLCATAFDGLEDYLQRKLHQYKAGAILIPAAYLTTVLLFLITVWLLGIYPCILGPSTPHSPWVSVMALALVSLALYSITTTILIIRQNRKGGDPL